MRLELARFGDITPHHRGAIVDAFAASTFVHGTVREVFLKRFRIPPTRAYEHAFLDAAARSTNLAGAGIASPLDFGLTDDGPVLVVPRIGARSLAALAKQAASIGRPINGGIATYVLGEAIRILSEASSGDGLAADPHGAISPNAILVTPDGRVLLSEGCMWSAGADDELTARISSGLSLFIPPERFSGQGPSSAGDVFGFGATLRFVLDRRLDEPLTSFCTTAMAEDPRRRFPSLVDMRQGLRSAAPGTVGRASLRAWLASLPPAPPKGSEGVDFVVPSTWPRGTTPRTPAPPVGKQLIRSSPRPEGLAFNSSRSSITPRPSQARASAAPPSSSSRPLATQILPPTTSIPPPRDDAATRPSSRAKKAVLLPSSQAASPSMPPPPSPTPSMPPHAPPYSAAPVAPAFAAGPAATPFPAGPAASPFSTGSSATPFSVGPAATPFPNGPAATPFPVAAPPSPPTTSPPIAFPVRDEPSSNHPPSHIRMSTPPSRPQATMVLPAQEEPANVFVAPPPPFGSERPSYADAPPPFGGAVPSYAEAPLPPPPMPRDVPSARPRVPAQPKKRGRTVVIERPKSLVTPFVIGFSIGLVSSIAWMLLVARA